MIRLITANEIRVHTSMGDVDADKFMHLLDDVQVLILEPVLGTKLFEKILSDFDSVTGLQGLYLTMFNKYIKPVLWHSVYAQYLRDGIILAQNTGIYTKQPENGSPSDLGNIQYVAKSAQSKADVYIERLDRFLCDSNIPEYRQTQDNEYDLRPNRDIQTIGGWWLGQSKKYDWRIDETNNNE